MTALRTPSTAAINRAARIVAARSSTSVIADRRECHCWKLPLSDIEINRNIVSGISKPVFANWTFKFHALVLDAVSSRDKQIDRRQDLVGTSCKRTKHFESN